MANPSSAEDVGPSPQTCCATCGTVFEVSPELLGSSDTRVRCGECYRIFDALENLVPRDAVGETGPGEESDPGDASGAGRGRGAAVAVFPGRWRAANGSRDTEDGAALDVTYSDFDLFSEDADLPDVAYFDRTSETPEFDFDSVELEDDETFNDTLFAHDVTIDAESVGVAPAPDPFAGGAHDLEILEADAPPAPLSFTYRERAPGSGAEPGTDDGPAGGPADPEPARAGPPPTSRAPAGVGAAPREPASEADRAAPAPAIGPLVTGPGDEDGGGATGDAHAVPFGLEPAPSGTRRRRWPVALMALALAGLLAGLHLWRVRDAPADDPFVRPAYAALCRITGCELPARVALDRLRLLRREMYEHPEIDDALVIDLAFRNEAAFAQRHPVLVVRLSTPSGAARGAPRVRPGRLPGGRRGPGDRCRHPARHPARGGRPGAGRHLVRDRLRRIPGPPPGRAARRVLTRSSTRRARAARPAPGNMAGPHRRPCPA